MDNTCEAVCAVRRVYFNELLTYDFDASRARQIVNPILISPRRKYTGMSCAVLNILREIRPRRAPHKLRAADLGQPTRGQPRRDKRYKRII